MDGVLGVADLSQPAARAFREAAGIVLPAEAGDEPFREFEGAIYLHEYSDATLSCAELRRALHEAWLPLPSSDPERPHAAAEERYANLLRACGYDAALQPSRALHPFVLTVHSTGVTGLASRAVDAAQFERVQCEIVKANGKQFVVGKVEVYQLHTSGGCQFAAFLTDPRAAVELTIDCSENAKNVRSDKGSGMLSATCKLANPDRSARLVLTLVPDDRSEAWGYSFKMSAYTAKQRPSPPPPPPPRQTPPPLPLPPSGAGENQPPVAVIPRGGAFDPSAARARRWRWRPMGVAALLRSPRRPPHGSCATVAAARLGRSRQRQWRGEFEGAQRQPAGSPRASQEPESSRAA